jgi:hypothetical protein
VAAQGLKKGNIVLRENNAFPAGFRHFPTCDGLSFAKDFDDGSMTKTGLPGPSPVTLFG